jgi:two-component system response regulator RegA
MGARTILVVDDDATFRERLGRALTERGHRVRTAGSRVEALVCAADELPGYAVLDLGLGQDSGLELLAALHAYAPSMTIVVLSGSVTAADVTEALRLGAKACLKKPADADEILNALLPEAGSGQSD